MIELKIKVEILDEKKYSNSEFQSIYAIGEWLNTALGNSHYYF